jgi:hypothetical protein
MVGPVESQQATITGYSSGLGTAWPGLDSLQGREIFLYSTACRPVLGPTQPPLQWVPRAVSLDVKLLKRRTVTPPYIFTGTTLFEPISLL